MSEGNYPIRAEPKILGEATSYAAAEELLSRLVAAAPASDPNLKRVLETLQSQAQTLVAERDRIRSERDMLESRLSQGHTGRVLIFAVLLVALAISVSGLVYVIAYLGDTDGVIAELQSDVARLTGRSEIAGSGRLSDRSTVDRLAPLPAPVAAEPAVRLGEPLPRASDAGIASAIRQLPEMQALVGEVSRLKASTDETAAGMGPITEQLQRLTGEFSVWRTAQEKHFAQLDRNTESLAAAATRLDAIVRESGELAETLAGATAEIDAVTKRVRELERKAAPSSHKPANPRPIAQPAPKKAESGIRNVYVTGPNDTLLSISRKFGISVNRLLDANGGALDDARRPLAAEQKVIIPE